MIIQRKNFEQLLNEPDNEFSIDLEKIIYIFRNKAGFLASAFLVGSALGFVYAFYNFSKPAEARLETDILFVDSGGPIGTWGLTGIREIDSVLSTFDPQIEIQEVVQQWPDWSLLDQALEQTGLKMDLGLEPVSTKDHFSQNRIPKKFKVKDQSNQRFTLHVDLESPRNKPVRLVLAGTLSESKLKLLADHFCGVLNRTWSLQALNLAEDQRPYAKKVRAQLVKAPAESVQNFPQIAQPTQITADLSLLPNYQKIRLIDQFLEKLENWPADLLFAYSGKQACSIVRPGLLLWILPGLLGTASLFGCLFLLNFFGSLSGKVLGEQDLALIHPAASIYSNNLGSAQLVNLLAASFSRPTGEKPGKLAAFVVEGASGLVEQVRMATEKCGRTFALANLGDAHICVFETDDPSSWICRLSHQGFCRILLTSRRGITSQAQHKLWQAEADLAGVPITDVILVES